MACPRETNRDIIRLVIGEERPPRPILELLGLEVFLELCLVIRTEQGSLIDVNNLTPEQVTQVNGLIEQALDIIKAAVPSL